MKRPRTPLFCRRNRQTFPAGPVPFRPSPKTRLEVERLESREAPDNLLSLVAPAIAFGLDSPDHAEDWAPMEAPMTAPSQPAQPDILATDAASDTDSLPRIEVSAPNTGEENTTTLVTTSSAIPPTVRNPSDP